MNVKRTGKRRAPKSGSNWSSGGSHNKQYVFGHHRTVHTADDTMHFAKHRHPKEAMDFINALRHDKKLCDITIKFHHEKIPAHKVILAAASPYFNAMFTGGMKEEHMDVITLKNNISLPILRMLIDFAYTSEITVNNTNVWELLPAATMLQVNHVIDACCAYLDRQIKSDTCIEIAEFAAEYGCIDLQNKCLEYINKHFTVVYETETFLTLNMYQLLTFLDSDELTVDCEADAYEAVCRWVMHDDESRLEHLDVLLKSVRCHYIPPKLLDMKLKYCPLLQNNHRAREYLERIFMDASVGFPRVVTSKKTSLKKPRKSCTPNVIYLAGGYATGRAMQIVQCYTPSTGEWKHLTDLPTPTTGLGLCFLRGYIYAIGGKYSTPDGETIDTNHVHVYDPKQNAWRRGCPLSVARNRVGVAVMDYAIYALGGSEGNTYHSSAERYEPEAEKWEIISPMLHNRTGVGVAVIGKHLYAIGGFDGEHRMTTVEQYQHDKDVWYSMANLKMARSGAGIAVLGHFIYAAGGFDGASQLCTVERYDATANQWSSIASMMSPRSALSMAAINGTIYAFGGFDGSRFLSSVEVYNHDHNTWRPLGDMKCGRSGHSITLGTEPWCKDGHESEDEQNDR